MSNSIPARMSSTFADRRDARTGVAKAVEPDEVEESVETDDTKAVEPDEVEDKAVTSAQNKRKSRS